MFEIAKLRAWVALTVCWIAAGLAPAAADAPYPILFVHGLSSSAEVWNESGLLAHLAGLGFPNGGTLHFKLGVEDEVSEVAIDWEEIERPQGRLWRVDFASSEEPSSNEAAIYLQAQALRLAIGRIRQLTGKDKVLLVGHSMGGLAIAAFMTGDRDGDGTKDFYRNDVAKVVTLGTPFGGSGLAILAEIVQSSSNAIRDLAKSSPLHRNVFLFGGNEDETDGSFWPDVNANGAEHDDIRGIAEMIFGADWPAGVQYFNIIGNWTGGGDCVVDAEDQFLPFADTKEIHAAHSAGFQLCPWVSCTETGAFDAVIEALDEPGKVLSSWPVSPGQFQGFLTNAAVSGTDFDLYRLSVQGTGKVIASLESISVPGTRIRLLDAEGHLACSGTCSAMADSGRLEVSLSTVAPNPTDVFVEVSGTVEGSDPGFGEGRDACDPTATDCSNCRHPYTLAIASTVAATQVAISASPGVVTLGSASTLTVRVLQENGSPAPAGIPVTLSTVFPGTFTGCSGGITSCGSTTDAAGRVVASFSSSTAGTATIVARAATGGSASTAVRFARGGVFASAAPNPVQVEFPSRISVQILDASGQPAGSGIPVTFSTSHPGLFSGHGSGGPGPRTEATDANGETWIDFTGMATGTANITIQAPNVDGLLLPVSITGMPGNLGVALSVAFSTGGPTESDYLLETRVTDGAGQAVVGENVLFSTTRGELSHSDCNTGPAGICNVHLRLTTSGSVTVKAKARSTTAATTFLAQVGQPPCADLSPAQSLGIGDGEVLGAAYVRDGSILVASEEDEVVRAWKTSEWSLHWTASASSHRTSQVSVSPNGSLVLVNHDDGQDIFDVATGALVCRATLESGEEAINGVFVTNSQHYHGSDGSSTTSPRLFRHASLCSTGTAVYTLPNGDDFEPRGHMDFSVSRNWIAVGSHDGELYVLNASTGSLIRHESVTAGSDSGYDVDFSEDGSKILAAGRGTLKSFDTTTWTARTYVPATVQDWIYGAKFLDNDTKIAVSGQQGLEILDAASGACLRKASLPGSGYEIDWSPQRKELAVGTSNGKVLIFKPLEPVDVEGPIINVDFPADEYVTNVPRLTTLGSVSDANAIATFKVDGSDVALSPSRQFQVELDLTPGENVIDYLAIDAAGNLSTQTRRVTLTTDTTPPVISLATVSPGEGPRGFQFSLSSQVIDGDSSVAQVEATIRDAGGQARAELPMTATGATTFGASYDSAGLDPGIYTVDIEASDSASPANSTSAAAVASFRILPCHLLTLGHEGSGSSPQATPIASPGCDPHHFYPGTGIQLAAAPDPGWIVAGWIGSNDDGSNSPVNSLTMPDEPHSTTVRYVEIPPLPCFQLQLSTTGMGQSLMATPGNSPGCPAGSYQGGDSILLTAAPAPGWRVDHWTGTVDDASGAASNSVSMPAASHQAGVTYVPQVTNLLVNGGCETSPLPWTCHVGCQLQLASSPIHGGTGSCLATALTATWQGPAQQIDPAKLVNGATLDTTVQVRATTPGFAVQALLFLQDSTGHSQFVPLTSFQTVGSSSFTAVGGSARIAWQGNLSNARFYIQGTSTDPFYIDDAFLGLSGSIHWLTFGLTGEGQGTVTSSPAGIDCGDSCQSIFSTGLQVELAAVPTPGSRFAGWTGACAGTGACRVRMDGNRFVGASFMPDDSMANLLVNPGCESTIEPWYCHAGCDLSLDLAGPFEGAGACRSEHLTAAWQGPSQLIPPSSLIRGANYCASAWIRGDAPFSAQLMMSLRESSGTTRFVALSPFQPVSATVYSLVSGDAFLDWQGTLQEARFYIQGALGNTVVDRLYLGRCPVARDDAFGINAATTLTVPSPGVLVNDEGPATSSAMLISGPSSGALVLEGDGAFVYLPAPGFEGVDRFVYQAAGTTGASNPATVRVNVGTLFADGFETGDTSAWFFQEP